MPLGFKIPIIAIPVLTLALLSPGVRFVLFAALGPTYQCSFWRNINSRSFTEDRERRAVAIRASAHEVQSDDRYSLWRTRDGDFWIPKRNREVLAFNLAEQEQDIYGRGANGVHPGDVVLDGGANVGVFTRKALSAGARIVIAVEPAPENVESLRRNFAPEVASGRVVIEALGLWHQPAELPLQVDAANSARNSFLLSFGPAMATEMVPLRTIDSIVGDLALARVDFIKLDIEGAEKNAIAGASQTMARFHPRLAVAVEHLADDPVAIPAAIHSMGLGYGTICGPCLFDPDAFSIRPDTLYFAPGTR
jgi:FkbM family methyltransferase